MKCEMMAAAVLAVLASAPSMASVTLDQDNIMTVPGGELYAYSTTIGSIGDFRQAQIVRAGRTGYVDHLDLQIKRAAAFGGKIAVELVSAATFADLPIATGTPAALIDAAALPTANGSILSVDVRGANFFVTPGAKFAILLRALDPSQRTRASWLFGGIDADGNVLYTRDYAGGQNNLFNVYGPNIWGASGVDRGFATYVDVTSSVVPEPASWALLIAGFGLAGAALRRRRALAAAQA